MYIVADVDSFYYVSSFKHDLQAPAYNEVAKKKQNALRQNNYVYQLLGYSLESLDLLAFQLFLDKCCIFVVV